MGFEPALERLGESLSSDFLEDQVFLEQRMHHDRGDSAVLQLPDRVQAIDERRSAHDEWVLQAQFLAAAHDIAHIVRALRKEMLAQSQVLRAAEIGSLGTQIA